MVLFSRQEDWFRSFLFLRPLLIICFLIYTPMADASDRAPVSGPRGNPDSVTPASIGEVFGKLPLYFIENSGQMDPRVSYYVKGQDKTLYFTSQAVVFLLTGKTEEAAGSEAAIRMVSHSQDFIEGDLKPGRSFQRWVVRLDFIGADPLAKPMGKEPTPTKISYFRGRPDEWKAGLNTYASLVYSDLWPGIDLVCTGTVNKLKYRFLVKPGADPAQIRLAYRGAEVSLSDGGGLKVTTPVASLYDELPYAYQEIEGREKQVSCSYHMGTDPAADGGVYGFRFGPYDGSKPLVLDPAVLVYCGYIGGSYDDLAYGIAVDSGGNVYVTGQTVSMEDTFPETVGPDLTHNGDYDVFVAKVNALGTGLEYCGYIGGSSSDSGNAIAVDSGGNAYVSGTTGSSQATFPVTGGPDLTINGGWDAFVAKVDASGTALSYCGYIGGIDDDLAYGIAVDSGGNAYVSGTTKSTESTFPVKAGPDLSHNGSVDAFAARVNASGNSLDYCGYIGGSGDDEGKGIALDPSGNAYVVGYTNSTESTFPVMGGLDLTHNGGRDAFVAKVNVSGTGLTYCGYIGGSLDDRAFGIASDSSGNAYVIGYTNSTESSFPVTVGPDLTHNGADDAFVAKINASGTALSYCGYIGGSAHDRGLGIAVDSRGNAYVTGYTYSTESTFPVTVGPDLSHNGKGDVFVARITTPRATIPGGIIPVLNLLLLTD